MISKEKLLNGYIENDQGELRKLLLAAAIHHDFDVTWVDDSEWFDNLNDALDNKYCFITDDAIDSADSETYIEGKNKLTIEDFVDTDCTFTSSDIFQQMLTLAEQNSMFIQFDGFTQGGDNTIVVTKQGSDTEYVVENKQGFDQLVESFNTLEKFERK